MYNLTIKNIVNQENITLYWILYMLYSVIHDLHKLLLKTMLNVEKSAYLIILFLIVHLLSDLGENHNGRIWSTEI